MKVLVLKTWQLSRKKAPNQLYFLSSLRIASFLAAYQRKTQCGSHLFTAKLQEAIECVISDVLAYSGALLNGIQWLDLGFSNLRIKASARSYLVYC